MKLTFAILSLTFAAHGVVPLEFPVTVRPSAEYVRDNGNGANAFLGQGAVAVFWNDAGQTQHVSGIAGALDNAFEMRDDVLVVGGYQAFNSGRVSNYLAEYKLAGFVNGLPTAATKVFETYWNNDGRWNRVFKTSNGGIAVVAFKWQQPGSYNNSIAYRSPAGAWSFYEQKYTGAENVVPAMDIQVQEGGDGLISIYFVRDSSHTISLARWKEVPGGLAFVDWRWDFLVNQCPFIFNKYVCRDGVMAPDYENPRLKSAKGLDGRILLSYPGSSGSKSGCWFRLCHPVITAVRTFVPPKDGKITKYVHQFSIDYVTFTSTPGMPYAVQQSRDLIEWTDMKRLDDGVRDIIATNATTTVRFFHTAERAPQLFYRVLPVSYIREPLVWVDDLYMERSFRFVAMLPRPDGIYFYVNEMIDSGVEDCVETLHLRKFANGVQTEIPVDYILKAWGENESPYVVVERAGGTFVKRL